MNLKLSLSILILCFTSAQAADFNMFNHIGHSAESIGKAGISSFDSQAHAIFNNPGAASFKQRSFSTFYTSLVDKENTIYSGAFGFNYKKNRILFGYTRSAIEQIPITNRDSNNIVVQTDATSYTNQLYQLGLQRHLSEKLSVGFTGNYYHVNIHSVSGTGLNANAGLTYHPINSLKLSLFAKNIIPKLNLNYSNDGSENLPTELYMGFQKKLLTQFELLGELSSQGSGDNRKMLKAIALKYHIPLTKNKFYITGGFQEFLPLKVKKTKATVGLGLELDILNIYFSYIKTDYQSNNFFTSISLNI